MSGIATVGPLGTLYTVLPDEIKEGYPHGQWLFDTPGLALNFLAPLLPEPEQFLPDLAPMMKKFTAFLASNDLFMPFESPHTPGINYLHRRAAERIMSTNPSWSRKVYVRSKPNGAALVDHTSGLPILSKLKD